MLIWSLVKDIPLGILKQQRGNKQLIIHKQSFKFNSPWARAWRNCVPWFLWSLISKFESWNWVILLNCNLAFVTSLPAESVHIWNLFLCPYREYSIQELLHTSHSGLSALHRWNHLCTLTVGWNLGKINN